VDAVADLPRTLRWRDADGSHTLTAPDSSLPSLLLERFLDALAVGAPPSPGLDDAYRALLWARAARRSLETGQRVEIVP
jgi:predicted dehydrogenase